MTILAMDIPDDPAGLPGWLERHLVGLELAALVAELEAVHGAAAAGPALEQVLGDRREAVLAGGLAALPPGRLRRLLRRPRLLLDLQESVLVEGGPYWRRLAESSAGPGGPSTRGRRHLDAIFREEGSPHPSPRGPRSAPRPARRPSRWAVVPAVAASLVLAAFLVERERSRAPGVVAATRWGWDRPGALPQDLPPAAYWNRLADAAEEWFSKRPGDPPALARRIAEFRQGCSTLILASHRPLQDGDRQWLVEKCRAWAAKLDKHLADVEAGTDPIRVRAEADATARRLVEALRERARSAA